MREFGKHYYFGQQGDFYDEFLRPTDLEKRLYT